MDSTLDTQTIQGVFDKLVGGLFDLTVCDVKTKKSYKILFDANVAPGDLYYGGYSNIKCCQTLAYINGHLFCFYIDNAANGGKFVNGDLTIKKIL